MDEENQPNYEMSLDLFKQLGPNLNRAFSALFDESISNSWDAYAKDVEIFIDKRESRIAIVDNGYGMSPKDFREKFLAIGNTGKSANNPKSSRKRKLIGRKGIGKLAYLFSAENVSVISKISNGGYVGGKVNYTKLNEAIKNNNKKYCLENFDEQLVEKFMKNHEQGTMLCFENLFDDKLYNEELITHILSINFNFIQSRIDFNITVNKKNVQLNSYKKLKNSTDCYWVIGDFDISNICNKGENIEIKELDSNNFRGFLATVKKSENLRFDFNGEIERVTVGFYDSGRLRENNLIRSAENQLEICNFLYGQVHFDDLKNSDNDDPYTSCRTEIVDNNDEFKDIKRELENLIENKNVYDHWSELRLKRGEEIDPDFPKKFISGRYEVSNIFENVKNSKFRNMQKNEQKNFIIDNLIEDCKNNIEPYFHYFCIENILRTAVEVKGIKIDKIKKSIEKMKKIEEKQLAKIDIDYNFREYGLSTHYVSAGKLVTQIFGSRVDNETLAKLNTFVFLRHVVAHSDLVSVQARDELRSIYKDIVSKIEKIVL